MLLTISDTFADFAYFKVLVKLLFKIEYGLEEEDP